MSQDELCVRVCGLDVICVLLRTEDVFTLRAKTARISQDSAVRPTRPRGALAWYNPIHWRKQVVLWRIPRRISHRRSGMANLPSVGAIP